MKKYLFLLILFPFLLNAQERVSDIKTLGVSSLLDFKNKIGFAEINGIQYILKEHHRLFIYKVKNDTILLIDSIEHKNYDFNTPPKLFFNHSGFNIQEGKYYRFINCALQIIDIASAKIEKEIPLNVCDLPAFSPVKLIENKLFYRSYSINKYIYFVCDLEDKSIISLDFLNGRNQIQFLNDKIFSMQDSTKLWVYDSHKNIESLIYQDPKHIYPAYLSKKDSVYTFRDETGNLFFIDNHLQITNNNCLKSKLVKSDNFYIRENLCLISHRIEGTNNKHKYEIKFYNLHSCNLEYSVTTDLLEDYVNKLHIVETEENLQEFLAFGYIGNNQSDEFSNSNYFFLDTNKKLISKVPPLSQIMDYTLFKKGDELICTGFNNYVWEFLHYIVSYNIDNQKFTKTDPNKFIKNSFLTMGYVSGNSLYLEAHLSEESPKLFKMAAIDSFVQLVDFDFYVNHGVLGARAVFPQEDRLYFINSAGLYSVLDDAKHEIPLNFNPYLFLGFPSYYKTVNFDNFISIIDIKNDTLTIKTLNTKTNQIIDYKETRFSVNYDVAPAGPFIFYFPKEGTKQLYYYDIRTNHTMVHPTLTYISSYDLTVGKNKALFFARHNDGTMDSKPNLVDYQTGTIESFDVHVNSDKYSGPGPDHTYFIIDNNSSQKTCRIREIDRQGELTTIYDGPGKYHKRYGHSGSEENQYSAFLLQNNAESCILIIHGNGVTQTHIVPYKYYYSGFDIVLAYGEDKFVVRTYDGLESELWLYDLYSQPKKLTEENSDSQTHIDDNILHVFMYNSEQIQVLEYDIHLDIVNENFTIPMPCNDSYLNNLFHLSSGLYITSFDCNKESEPWVLDVKSKQFYKLADINPGFRSSSPNSFTIFKDYVYFMATSEEHRTQWYRKKLDLSDGITEPVPVGLSLSIYPNPSAQSIQLKDNFSGIYIYSGTGTLVQELDSYSKGDFIDISHLQTHTYFVKAVKKNGELSTGKFLKVSGN